MDPCGGGPRAAVLIPQRDILLRSALFNNLGDKVPEVKVTQVGPNNPCLYFQLRRLVSPDFQRTDALRDGWVSERACCPTVKIRVRIPRTHVKVRCGMCISNPSTPERRWEVEIGEFLEAHERSNEKKVAHKEKEKDIHARPSSEESDRRAGIEWP